MGKKCDIECPKGRYGINCVNTCDCKNGADCDNRLGNCLCPRGFSGKKCETRTCPDDLYGEECDKTCHCNPNTTISCHPWTGICKFICTKIIYHFCPCNKQKLIYFFPGECICIPGYTGEHCHRQCQPPFYGLNCSKVCGCNQYTGLCHHITGKTFFKKI